MSSKNRLLLNVDATHERLEMAIGDWVQHYNHVRYHEALEMSRQQTRTTDGRYRS